MAEGETVKVATSPVPAFLLARGFALLFWGLLVTTVLLCADAFLVFNTWNLSLPGYVFGSMLTGWGVLCLYEHLEWRNGDLRTAAMLLLLVAMQLYLAPFIIWRNRQPLEIFFWGNYLALLIVMLLTMIFCMMLGMQVLGSLDRPRRRGWLAAIFITLLVLCIGFVAWIAWDIFRALTQPSGLLLTWRLMLGNHWCLAALLLGPAGLTMGGCLLVHDAVTKQMLQSST
ncbi:MAG: hypothetical protein ABR497_03545 [Kiritimatiellia bacterium]|nr:hypothetical protein [Lentisphaerota bacterium]